MDPGTVLSVIISTSPGREENLVLCLEMLQRQSFQDFEVIVVNDGSRRGRDTLVPFQDSLQLTYHWRTNDGCPSRSRNLGAALAESNKLVFIDTDILLNPQALDAYHQHLAASGAIVYGYYSIFKTLQAPSRWFPRQWVNWLDKRFIFDPAIHLVAAASRDRFRPVPFGQSHLWIHRQVFDLPQISSWSGNFAVRKNVFDALKGFDETFVGWGYEDIDFGNRAVAAGIPLHFSLDAWGEHLVHPMQEKFHLAKKNLARRRNQAEQNGYAPVRQPVLVHRSEATLQELEALMGPYLQQSVTVPDL